MYERTHVRLHARTYARIRAHARARDHTLIHIVRLIERHFRLGGVKINTGVSRDIIVRGVA